MNEELENNEEVLEEASIEDEESKDSNSTDGITDEQLDEIADTAIAALKDGRR